MHYLEDDVLLCFVHSFIFSTTRATHLIVLSSRWLRHYPASEAECVIAGRKLLSKRGMYTICRRFYERLRHFERPIKEKMESAVIS